MVKLHDKNFKSADQFSKKNCLFAFLLLSAELFRVSETQHCVNTTIIIREKKQGNCYRPIRQRPSYQFLLNAWRQNMALGNRRNANCDALFLNGERTSGVHTINLQGANLEVFCEFQYEGHNWVLIQRRMSAALNFDNNWAFYQGGFGDPNTNYWLGLNAIHRLSLTLRRPVLRVDISDGTTSAYAEYSIFRVAAEQRKYRLRVGGYKGTAGDGLSYHNRAPFTTVDSDNDMEHFGRNCAMLYGGGWWFKDCLTGNLNGRYGRTADQRDGVTWYFWKSSFDSLSTTAMRIRAGA